MIDYLGISFRTLSHYPMQTYRTPIDTLSYFLACFTLTCFMLELCYMAWIVNGLHGIEDKKITPLQRNVRGVMMDGLNEESVKKSWFVRNYNLLYLLRFFAFICLLFGLQYLQIFQALFVFILMITFTAMTIYYQVQFGIFETRGLSIIKVIQECSIAVIMVMVNAFCLDSFRGFLSSKAKTLMVMIFMVLLILNIFLEVVSVILSIVQLCSKSKKSKVDPVKNKKKEIGKVLDIDTATFTATPNLRDLRKNARFEARKQKIQEAKEKANNNRGLDERLKKFLSDRQEIKIQPKSVKKRMMRAKHRKMFLNKKRKGKINNSVKRKKRHYKGMLSLEDLL